MNYSRDEIIVLSISAGVIVLISFLLGFFLRKKSEKIKQLPFLTITIILFALEIVKQIINLVEGYDMWAFPLHFCSTYFIWFSIAHFTKGKFSQAMKTVAFVASFYLAALFYFDPSSIIGGACSNIFESFSTFHTFFFHHLVILYFCLVIALQAFDFKFKHLIYWAVSMTAYYCTAVTFAHVFDVNYMNILTSNIPFMESLRLSIGQLGYTIILGSLTIGVGAILIALASLITKKIKEKKHERV